MREVLPGFGIVGGCECQFYSGGFNHTYRVRTEDGITYYLRAYRKPWRTLVDIQYELELLNHLKRKGFPVPQPIPYRDGQYFCAVPAPEGLRYLALFSEAIGKGISYEQEPEQVARCYGQAVAQLHHALDDFTSTFPRFHLDIRHFIDQPLYHITPFLAHRPADWRFVQQFAERLRGHLLRLPASQLELGACHGDLQGYHANVDSNGTLTFFDFDCCGLGFRAYDLAVFRWASRLKEKEEVWWEPFLRGYLEVRPISDQNIRAIPWFVAGRYLWHVWLHTTNAGDWGHGWLDEAYFNRFIKNLHAVETDYKL